MKRLAPCLMVQGTASGVGKSFIATALCRLFARAGYRVAPFKSQNMSNNAAVTSDGGEIGRAQAAQAEAAGLAPSVDMNPILLKPEGDDRSQVVVRGRAVGTMNFRAYGRLLPSLRPVVAASLARLRREADLVIIEGAGSPAEINLTDVVNMHVARLADAPVLLVGDIDRGGVFAAFVGTLALLADDDRARVAGFVVNRLRGDASLLDPGLELLHRRTGVPVLGVLAYLDPALVPAEDALDLDERDGAPPSSDALDVAVLRLGRLSNFDDFEPLAAEPGVRVRFVDTPAPLARADLVVLPGTKSTVADLELVRARGLAGALAARAAEGRPLLGVCGGYQMLGRAIEDPEHVESAATVTPGLGLLPAVTVFAPDKTTVRVRARVAAPGGLFGRAGDALVDAYEIHAGVTRAEAPAAFRIVERDGAAVDAPDGAVRGSIVGTYLHGLFAGGAVRRALLEELAARRGRRPDARWGCPPARDRYDRLADLVGPALDLAAIGRLVGLRLIV